MANKGLASLEEIKENNIDNMMEISEEKENVKLIGKNTNFDF